MTVAEPAHHAMRCDDAGVDARFLGPRRWDKSRPRRRAGNKRRAVVELINVVRNRRGVGPDMRIATLTLRTFSS
jgi:hypothetical protein